MHIRLATQVPSPSALPDDASAPATARRSPRAQLLSAAASGSPQSDATAPQCHRLEEAVDLLGTPYRAQAMGEAMAILASQTKQTLMHFSAPRTAGGAEELGVRLLRLDRAVARGQALARPDEVQCLRAGLAAFAGAAEVPTTLRLFDPGCEAGAAEAAFRRTHRQTMRLLHTAAHQMLAHGDLDAARLGLTDLEEVAEANTYLLLPMVALGQLAFEEMGGDLEPVTYPCGLGNSGMEALHLGDERVDLARRREAVLADALPPHIDANTARFARLSAITQDLAPLDGPGRRALREAVYQRLVHPARAATGPTPEVAEALAREIHTVGFAYLGCFSDCLMRLRDDLRETLLPAPVAAA